MILSLAAAPARSDELRVGDIVVADAWGRASVGTGAGALYVTLRNEGDAPEQLVGVETPAAKRAEVHVNVTDGDVVGMRPAEAVEIPPGATVVLAPGGTHIMLTGLARPLKQGDSILLTLRFAAAGAATVPARIGSIGAKGPWPSYCFC